MCAFSLSLFLSPRRAGTIAFYFPFLTHTFLPLHHSFTPLFLPFIGASWHAETDLRRAGARDRFAGNESKKRKITAKPVVEIGKLATDLVVPIGRGRPTAHRSSKWQ